jgi:hypothetical protein
VTCLTRLLTAPAHKTQKHYKNLGIWLTSFGGSQLPFSRQIGKVEASTHMTVTALTFGPIRLFWS